MERIQEVKNRLSERTGIPVNLLKGETLEELVAECKALLLYKREHEAAKPKTTAEQFAEWAQKCYGEGGEVEDNIAANVDAFALEIRRDIMGEPIVRDGGEVTGLPTSRSTAEQFAEWFEDKTAYDPFKSAKGWTAVH